MMMMMALNGEEERECYGVRTCMVLIYVLFFLVVGFTSRLALDLRAMTRQTRDGNKYKEVIAFRINSF